MYFDSHCHLTAEQFDADRDAVIQRAQDAGVTQLLTLATDIPSAQQVLALAERFQGVYAAVGIHPESVRDASLDDLMALRRLAAHDKVVAIGEIGLDYYWDKTGVERQQLFFEKQLELAVELGLPVAIHDRDAHDAILGTLEKMYGGEGPRRRGAPYGILHAFSGDLAMAQTAFDLGFFVSLGGPITFRNNPRAPDLVRGLALDKLLIETDSPYLAPHPQRGKRNEPANVTFIAERIAVLKGLSTEEVATQTTKNAQRIFGIS
jgi:TatD DNase family protein